jgi:hypothetical protein
MTKMILTLFVLLLTASALLRHWLPALLTPSLRRRSTHGWLLGRRLLRLLA